MVDAERDPRDAVCSRTLVDRLHQRRADSVAPLPLDDRDRDLRRRFVDEALAVHVLREEPVPDEPDGLSLELGNERRVTLSAPALVEDRELRQIQQLCLG